MKLCSKCEVGQEDSEFNRRAAARDGLAPWCKSCMFDYRTIYNAVPAHKARLAERARERDYGVTPEAWAELIVNGCMICGTELDLCVDHDHGSGVVRGALCRKHNTAIGMLDDDLALVESAAAYLRAAA